VSSEPTYTTPLATAGDDRTGAAVGVVHTTAPVAVSRACTRESSDPM
jgi:hypothetical protein